MYVAYFRLGVTATGDDLKVALDTRYDELSYLGEAGEINVNVFAQYMTFVNEVTPATAEELGNEAILEGVKAYDAWAKALKDYLASADAALTAEDAKIIFIEYGAEEGQRIYRCNFTLE